MKAYGYTRRDKLACKYGCCTTKSGKLKNSRSIVDSAKRKKARQLQQKVIEKELKLLVLF